MADVILLDHRLVIPHEVAAFAAFRRWVLTDDIPDDIRIDYLCGRIEIDSSPEDLHTHGKLKTEFVVVLGQRIKGRDLGELYTDSTRVSCPSADLSVEPDLVFVSNGSLDTGRVRLVPKAGGAADRYIELEGPPDLVVEIVSDVSVRKDTERLPVAYERARVTEFWLVDARGDEVLFQIQTRRAAGYESVAADADGFQQSTVLECSYRLERSRNSHGRLTFDLVVRE